MQISFFDSPHQQSVGLLLGSTHLGFTQAAIPRLEMEFTITDGTGPSTVPVDISKLRKQIGN